MKNPWSPQRRRLLHGPDMPLGAWRPSAGLTTFSAVLDLRLSLGCGGQSMDARFNHRGKWHKETVKVGISTAK